MPDPLSVLNEAEQEHLLDLPVADPFQRGAAGLLDCIMAFLLGSGVDHAGNAIFTHLSNLKVTFSFSPALSESKITTFIIENAGLMTRMGAIGCKIGFLIFAFGWLVHKFGGSPAKLLLGLKIVDLRSGKPLQVNQALLRQAVLIGTFPGVLAAFIRKDKKTMHDVLTGTSVRKVHGVR